MSLCICALDDDESILYTLEAMAITQNWTFRGTTQVEQCLDWIRDGVVELLLLDYHMPLQNGLDVLRKVQLISPSLPVLMLTVELSPEVAEELLLAGAEDFINKPIRLADFLSRIRLHRRLVDHRLRDQPGDRKGIGQETLQKVVEYLRKKNSSVEIDDVVRQCGVSYTTAHRYLDYLAKRGLVSCSEILQNGKPGRPTRAYRFITISPQND